MYNFRSIFWNNRCTYRDYSSEKLLPVLPRYIVIIITSFLFAAVFSVPSFDLLRVFATVLGVLAGFNFSILFFLLNNPSSALRKVELAIEDKLAIERLEKLSEEIFYNVSYFIAVAVFAIALSVFLMLPFEKLFMALNWVYSIFDAGQTTVENHLGRFEVVGNWLKIFFTFLLWSLVIDALATMVRLLRRIGFLFSQTIQLQREK